MIKPIIDNLWQVGGEGLTASGDAASYLIRFGPSAALVDAGTGFGHDRLLKNIAHCLPADIPIEYLLLTHCHFDHTGGAEAVRDEYGCRIVAHVQDAVFLEAGDNKVTAAAWYGERMAPLSVDWKLDQTRTPISIGTGEVTAIHWPGHSPGSLVYYAELDGLRVLFGQDVHGPVHPALLSDETAYQSSLEMLLDLEADLLLEGHFGVLHGKEEIRRFINSFRSM